LFIAAFFFAGVFIAVLLRYTCPGPTFCPC